jgi:hypothetical protein
VVYLRRDSAVARSEGLLWHMPQPPHIVNLDER